MKSNMLLKIFLAGEPVLRKKATRVSTQALSKPATQQFIDLMIATMQDHPGVGLAAPQVGSAIQIIVIEDKRSYTRMIPEGIRKEQQRKAIPLTTIVNPRLLITDSEVKYYFEGCMSVPGYRMLVPRVNAVEVNGIDRGGKPIKIIATGWKARILQHEIDHLNGVLCTDKMVPSSLMNDKIFAKHWQNANAKKIEKYWLR